MLGGGEFQFKNNMKLFLTFWLKSPITTLWDKSKSEKKFTNTFGLCSQGWGFGELEVRWGGGINHTGKKSHIIPAQWLGLGYPIVTSPQEIQGGCLPELNSCMEKFLCFRIWLFPFCSIWVDLEGGNNLYHSSWKQPVEWAQTINYWRALRRALGNLWVSISVTGNHLHFPARQP